MILHTLQHTRSEFSTHGSQLPCGISWDALVSGGCLPHMHLPQGLAPTVRSVWSDIRVLPVLLYLKVPSLPLSLKFHLCFVSSLSSMLLSFPSSHLSLPADVHVFVDSLPTNACVLSGRVLYARSLEQPPPWSPCSVHFVIRVKD